MNVSAALTEIRKKIWDQDKITMQDDDLLTCLNEAIQYVSSYLISENSPILIHDLIINTETITLPENYVKTAGQYPVKITENTLKWLDYETGKTMKLRYFSTCPKVAADGVMPFAHDALHQIIIKLAAIYAGNQMEADISQDKALLDEINAALAKTIGGAA